MSAKRFGRVQKASAIVPLALLSAAWTASLAGIGPTTAVSAPTQAGSLPDGTSVPTEAIEAPASVTGGAGLGGAVSGNTAQIIASSSTNGIPSAALAAYQRAETVINSADETCNLSWQLVAAIGRVESNHGRFGGNTLDDNGLAVPGIYGIALDGSNNTAVIRDTDAGLFDDDQKFDRAVGPMQFIPSTWSVVGVDADGDAQRNPQDIDDAALASAVYLCSGNDDLGTLSGQRAAVYRYNHSTAYVDLVLSIMDAYLDGEYMSVPNSTSAAGYFVPNPSYNPGNDTGNQPGDDKTLENPGGGNTSGPTDPGTTEPEPEPEPTDNGGNPGDGLPTG
ncbi:MAG: lytic transglycosylase domain-containing protein, partial [Nocardioides sp.]